MNSHASRPGASTSTSSTAGNVGTMRGVGHHPGREVDGIEHRRQWCHERRSAPSWRRPAAAPTGLRARTGRWRSRRCRRRTTTRARVAGGKLQGGQRRQLQAHVDQLLARVHANDRELAKDRVERAIRSPRAGPCAQAPRARSPRWRRPSGSRQACGASRAAASASTKPAGSDRPSVYTAITLVPSSCTSARMNSAMPSAASLPQLMVTRKPRPSSLRARVRHHADASALAHHRHRARRETRVLVEHRAERRGEADRRVDDADAVRTAELDAGVAADGLELALASRDLPRRLPRSRRPTPRRPERPSRCNRAPPP